MKDLEEIKTAVTRLEIHVEYIKTSIIEMRGEYKALNRLKNMTYGITAFLIVVLPLIVVI